MPEEDQPLHLPPEVVAKLRQNSENLGKSVESLTLNHAMLSGELLTISALCLKLALHVGLTEIDSLNVADWITREKKRYFEQTLTGIEDLDPGLAARLQTMWDEATGQG